MVQCPKQCRSHFAARRIHAQVLFELILAANYLDIKSLLDLTCAKVASMIKGKNTEEIRSLSAQALGASLPSCSSPLVKASSSTLLTTLRLKRKRRCPPFVESEMCVCVCVCAFCGGGGGGVRGRGVGMKCLGLACCFHATEYGIWCF